jgi:hypothetical protein
MASLFYVLGGYKGCGLSNLCFRWIQRLWPLYFMLYVDTKVMGSPLFVLGGYKVERPQPLYPPKT